MQTQAGTTIPALKPHTPLKLHRAFYRPPLDPVLFDGPPLHDQHLFVAVEDGCKPSISLLWDGKSDCPPVLAAYMALPPRVRTLLAQSINYFRTAQLRFMWRGFLPNLFYQVPFERVDFGLLHAYATERMKPHQPGSLKTIGVNPPACLIVEPSIPETEEEAHNQLQAEMQLLFDLDTAEQTRPLSKLERNPAYIGMMKAMTANLPKRTLRDRMAERLKRYEGNLKTIQNYRGDGSCEESRVAALARYYWLAKEHAGALDLTALKYVDGLFSASNLAFPYFEFMATYQTE